ncbi:ABC-type cobalamin/Fe3+-siderophores transport system ATPase subunit [Rhizobium leguminosarum]
MTLIVEAKQRLGAFSLDAAFTSERGVTALFGRSGSGKTSMIRIIAGLARPDEGRVVLDGEPLTETETDRHLRSETSPPLRLCLPGGPAFPASQHSRQSLLWPLVRGETGTRRELRSHRRPARHRDAAGAQPLETLRRREAARRHRPRTSLLAPPAVDGRAARRPR